MITGWIVAGAFGFALGSMLGRTPWWAIVICGLGGAVATAVAMRMGLP